MSDYIKEKVEEFEDNFKPIESGYVGVNILSKYSKYETAMAAILAFLRDALQEMEERTREEIANNLPKVDPTWLREYSSNPSYRYAFMEGFNYFFEKLVLALFSHNKETGEKKE